MSPIIMLVLHYMVVWRRQCRTKVAQMFHINRIEYKEQIKQLNPIQWIKVNAVLRQCGNAILITNN